MPHQGGSSPGPFAVGLMALHDRAFFERLLSDPRRTLTQSAIQADLHLTAADVDEVVRLIEEAGHSITPARALAAWDGYAANGHWGGNGWPTGWPPERLALGNPPRPPQPGRRGDAHR